MPSKGRLAERSEATRGALLDAARALFAAGGFAQTSVEDIVRRAGVTRGALYHHFASKEDLFAAVYERMEAELAARSLGAASGGSDPLDRLRRGIDAFLDACLEPDVQRIVLLDALSVLGWETWHDVGVKYNFRLMVAGLEAAAAAGQIAAAPPAGRPIEPLAHVVQGALMRAGLVVARAPDPADARALMGREIAALLDGLAARAPRAAPKRRARRR